MNQLLTSIQNLSNPVKLGVAVAGGGGLVAALSMFGWNRSAMAVIFAGIVLVGLLMLLYKQVLKLLAKRKAAPMTQALASSAAAAPQGISDPARRARLDDMRRNFEGGVEKFRAAGKNIYALPWYLLVGEPGSGKTEAVRHCNVGFPPGLQDQLQGVGGTINMNWWFTNHAVILDTAGRLMFEEVEPGSTSEWQEFLKLLRKNRPNCPVNGMLLVIPAESLIKDTADALERKGGKIAQQLDQIQRALGVRFPVFVVITKCDLINGFREFFDDMKDPQLQHQILGWSNPAPLDEPFNAELVEKHLEQVQKRLIRRRLGLLLDPVHREDPTARRTDEVDALFAFPEALVKIAPRLRRYLEMIFVAGVWSAKPLFLRGIYFTSSMREGSALDADLAEALGMPVESLPEGRVWERDRAYFLRDLFISKIFREQGLVTRAVNTKAQQRQRRAIITGAAGVGAVLLAAFTYFGSSGLKRDIVEPKEFWTQTKETYVRGRSGNFIDNAEDYLQPVLSRTSANSEVFTYDGELKARFDEFGGVPEDLRRLGRFPEQLRRSAVASVRVPWVFTPVAMVTGDTALNLAESERREAARVLIEASVVRPLVDAAAERLRLESAKGLAWTPEATEALAQVLRLEAARATDRTPEGGIRIAPLVAYAVLSRDEPQQYSARDIEVLQGVADWLYKDGGAKLPPRGSRAMTETLGVGLRSFTQAWTPTSPSAGGLAEVVSLIGALREFQDAEGELLRIFDQFGGAGDYSAAYEAWSLRYATLNAAAERVGAGFAAVGDRASLMDAYRVELERFRTRAGSAHDLLIRELEPIKPVEGERDSAQTARFTALREVRASLQSNMERIRSGDAGLSEIEQRLAQLDALMVARNAAGDPAYKVRAQAYATVNAQFGEGGAQGLGVGEFGPRFEEIQRSIAAARSQATQRLAVGQGAAPGELSQRLERARSLCNFALDVAERRLNKAMVLRLLAVAPDNPDRFADEAAAFARSRNLLVARPTIPLTRAAREGRAEFDPRFSPGAGAALLLDIRLADEAVGQREGESSVLETSAQRDQFQRIRLAAREYQTRFADYWRDGHLQELRIAETDWTKFTDVFRQTPQGFTFNSPLKAIATAMNEAATAADRVLTPEQVSAIRNRAQATSRFVDEQTFVATCDRVLNVWSGLAQFSLAADARTRVLQAAFGGTFDENYVIASGAASQAGGGEFASEFWRDFCLGALTALTVAAEQQTKRAAEQLQMDAAFPITAPRDGRTMAPESVTAARTSVRTILMRGGAAGSQGGAPQLSKSSEFRLVLDRLAGPGLLSEQERSWLDRADAVLRALPEGDERALPVRISVIFNRPSVRGDRPLQDLIQTFGVSQGSAACAGTHRPRQAVQDPLMVAYPGENLRFCFFTEASPGQAAATREFRGPWAALQMLHDLQAEPTAEGGGRVWEAELVVPFRVEGGGEVKLSLWLQLEFERPVPPRGRWPE